MTYYDYNSFRAGVAQWQSIGFPSRLRGFDSLRPLRFFFRLENRMLDAGFSVPHFKERPYSADEKINALDHSELFVLEVVAFIEFK